MRTPRRVFALCSASILAVTVLTVTVAAPSSASSPFFDDDLDGVWVGTLKAKHSSGTRTYPLLINLDADTDGARGVVLIADDLGGDPTDMDFVPISGGTRKGKKLTFSIAVDSPLDFPSAAGTAAADTHSFVLRFKKEKLKGNMSSTASGLKKSKVELSRVDSESPFQQVWVTSIASLRGRAGNPVALLILQNGSLGGAGFVGDMFGDLDNLTLDGDRLTGELNTDSGVIDLDLTLGNNNLEGTFAGAVDSNVTLAAGNRATAPTISSFKPSSLPAGKSTLVTLKGKNLADGFLLHFDHAGVYAEVPTVTSAKAATVSVYVPDTATSGTVVEVQLAGADGSTEVTKKSLKTEAATAVNFDEDISPRLALSCALSGCHVTPQVGDPAYNDGGEAAGGLDLEGNAYSRLVNIPAKGNPAFDRVEPGDADNSYLIMKLRGDSRIVGDRMPLGGPFLDAATMDIFVRWVNEGAAR